MDLTLCSIHLSKLTQIQCRNYGNNKRSAIYTNNNFTGSFYITSITDVSGEQYVEITHNNFSKVCMLYYRVIDTPGLADPDEPPEEIASILASVILQCPGGVHAFLYTHNATDYRFTAELQSVKDQVTVRYQYK